MLHGGSGLSLDEAATVNDAPDAAVAADGDLDTGLSLYGHIEPRVARRTRYLVYAADNHARIRL